MDSPRQVYLGTDSGATTSKVGGVFADGSTVSTKLRQRPTPTAEGPDAVIAGWIAAAEDFLAANDLDWSNVAGVGLAIPRPHVPYRVLGAPANLPPSVCG